MPVITASLICGTQTGKLRHILEEHNDSMGLIGHYADIDAIIFSPDGKMLATASEDYTARLWDAQTGAHRLALKGHTSEVSSIAFSPDGKTVRTGSLDGTLRLWDTNTGTQLRTITGHTNRVYSIAFSPDGKY
ncbi:MAG: hypothetical protein OXU23_21265 [Candidatus Poribacteria bacterium]|nr:hypothetical protein [Candidatus Poribacteria bacterium]